MPNATPVEILLKANVDPNAKDASIGTTALYYAVKNVIYSEKRQCFDLLANHPDIDFSIKDEEGRMALDYWDFSRFPDENLAKKWEASQREALKTPKPEEPSNLFAYCSFHPGPKGEGSDASKTTSGTLRL